MVKAPPTAGLLLFGVEYLSRNDLAGEQESLDTGKSVSRVTFLKVLASATIARHRKVPPGKKREVEMTGLFWGERAQFFLIKRLFPAPVTSLRFVG